MYGHVETLLGAINRGGSCVAPVERTFICADGDFLDVDQYDVSNPKGVVIISHGLEGSARSRYVLEAVSVCVSHNYAVLAWNMRGCSGRPNRFLRSYHSGFTDDLAYLVDVAGNTYLGIPIILVGFSVGGNITLKYLGESGVGVVGVISGACTFSVPTDISVCADYLHRGFRRVYERHFLRSLKGKLHQKKELFPQIITCDFWKGIASFETYDERFTAPWFGFSSARSYWLAASSNRFIPEIKIPTIIVNAKNDPFFPLNSNPVAEAGMNPFIHLELTRFGGHNRVSKDQIERWLGVFLN
jgi:predicted alpha/beta-fold hydrolase